MTSKTSLQQRLENLGSLFTKIGLYSSILIFLAFLINLGISLIFTDLKFVSATTLDNFVEALTMVITIVIVAVPEGLPMTIAISLAYSVRRMQNDKILVRNLGSPEVMGQVEEICTGKTATLTKNEQKVVQFYAQSRQIRNTRKNTLFNCDLDGKFIDLLVESILYNSDARIEMDDQAFY